MTIPPIPLNLTVVKYPPVIEAISILPKSQLRSGITILAFSSYPNGFPVLDLDEKTARKMAEKALPSVSVEEKRLLFGRTKWQGRTVGAVVYPISEQDVRQMQNIKNDSRLTEYDRAMKINDYMPTVMSKDAGVTRIFDIQRSKLLGVQEAEDLSKVGHVALANANKQAEKITQPQEANSTKPIKGKEGAGKPITHGDGKHHKHLSALRQQLVAGIQKKWPILNNSMNVTTPSAPAPLVPFSALPVFSQPTTPIVSTETLKKIFSNRVLSTKPLPTLKEPQNQHKMVPMPLPLLPLNTLVVNKPVANTQQNQPLPEINTLFSSVAVPFTTVPIDFYAIPTFS